MPCDKTSSDSTNLGLMLKTSHKPSKHWLLFFFLGSLKHFRWPAGRQAATNKTGEMCSISCKSATTGFFQRGYHGIPRTTHVFFHNFDFHWTPDLFSKHVKVSRQNSHHLETICEEKERLRFSASPLQWFKRRGRRWYALPSAFFKLRKKRRWNVYN